MKKRVVMTFGTFDLLHPGHLHYLSEAKKLGDYLITIVARDATVERLKWRKPRESEEARVKKLQESGVVDEVILGVPLDYYAVIKEIKPDVLYFGYDQRSFNGEKLTEYLKKHDLHPQILIGEPFEPEKWKSSKL